LTSAVTTASKAAGCIPESPGRLTTYTGLVGSVLTAPALPFLWQTPTEASTWIGIASVERGDDREQSRRVHPREPRPAHHQDPGESDQHRRHPGCARCAW
jgi:hypothetical protein